MSPTRKTGFSDEIGAWKIIATRRPRMSRSWRSESPISSRPSSFTDPSTRAPMPGASPAIA